MQGGDSIVAGRVAQGRTMEINGVAEGDAVAVQLAVGDAQAEYQSVAAGAGHIVGPGGLAVVQGHLDARGAARGVDGRVFAQVDGEVEALPCDVGAVARHADAGHRRGDAVDGVGLADQAASHGVVGGIDNSGAAVVQRQRERAGTAEVVDHDAERAAIDTGDAGQGTGNGPAKDHAEVADIDTADVLAEGHVIADRTAVGDRAAGAGDAGDARRAGVHQHGGGAADTVQGQGQIVTGGVLDAAAVEVEAAADTDAIAVGVTGLHGVLEDQGRAIAAARHQGGVAGAAADIQDQARRAAGEYILAGVDVKAQHVAGLVAADGRHADAGHGRYHAVHQDAGTAAWGEGGGAVVARSVTQGAAVELDGIADGDAVAVQLAAGDHQAEHQGTATAAGDVLGIGGAAGVQGHFDARRTTTGVDGDRFAEVDGEVQGLALVVVAIAR